MEKQLVFRDTTVKRLTNTKRKPPGKNVTYKRCICTLSVQMYVSFSRIISYILHFHEIVHQTLNFRSSNQQDKLRREGENRRRKRAVKTRLLMLT